MSHFYGTIDGRTRRSQATRCGDKSSGLVTHAASWSGAVRVELRHNPDTGHDEYTVSLVPWRGSGASRTLATGTLTK